MFCWVGHSRIAARFRRVSVGQPPAFLHQDGEGLAGLLKANWEHYVSGHLHTVVISCLTVHTHHTAQSALLGEATTPENHNCINIEGHTHKKKTLSCLQRAKQWNHHYFCINLWQNDKKWNSQLMTLYNKHMCHWMWFLNNVQRICIYFGTETWAAITHCLSVDIHQIINIIVFLIVLFV